MIGTVFPEEDLPSGWGTAGGIRSGGCTLGGQQVVGSTKAGDCALSTEKEEANARTIHRRDDTKFVGILHRELGGRQELLKLGPGFLLVCSMSPDLHLEVGHCQVTCPLQQDLQARREGG